jgi:antitoxin (DNA-binding transcriptional repressor) of toxin-antitoxin stability system
MRLDARVPREKGPAGRGEGDHAHRAAHQQAKPYPGGQTTTGEEGKVLAKVASGSYRVLVRAVGLKVLKNKLSEYIRLAAGGETVLVTDRDRVVAEIRAPEAGRAEWLSDVHLAEAVRSGLIQPARAPRAPLPERRPVAPTATLLDELERDRGDR